ncbi:MAG: hypothetical protein CUN49_01180 [Candidatus Thermofonsia Clade 1 bacterium]|jgi:hypothetical protein|uniref:Uncharacterized protein n=1 Tax=Candidatus Thermofonsia Clade 1 bacterium TaxID=2364210 RepID=A0A2M8PIC3_9CHLR|nr:MAG: hypothetical protein CUN49_01180 [Candidatus Thermofonsia Clade 1 bacterium]RMF53811.1 MAG: hypothetical protein D6749_01255 [Chloroflexota bacterium]
MTEETRQPPSNQNVSRQTPLPPLPNDDASNAEAAEAGMIEDRISRLSGEPAPDISPEEFARLQQHGAINIDSRGRIRVNRRDEADPGVSLRKRRAWYA